HAMVFLVSGVHKGIYFSKAVEEFREAAIPFLHVSLIGTIILHLVASLGLITGLFARESALALAVFTLVATIKVQAFWNLSGKERLDLSRIALANLAIIGGLILFAIVGPGRLVL
ncbi:MAG: DoxX family protein, partial [Gammaproteobacteria bacterium]